MINTLVTNYLAYQILLSLTFLYGNKLIIDTNVEIVVDKCNGYNLMTLDSQETLTTTLVKKKIQTNHILELSCLVTTPIREYIVAVEYLARSVESNNIWLQALNEKYHQEFADCFREISHVSQLSTDIYH